MRSCSSTPMSMPIRSCKSEQDPTFILTTDPKGVEPTGRTQWPYNMYFITRHLGVFAIRRAFTLTPEVCISKYSQKNCTIWNHQHNEPRSLAYVYNSMNKCWIKPWTPCHSISDSLLHSVSLSWTSSWTLIKRFVFSQGLKLKLSPLELYDLFKSTNQSQPSF